MKQKITNVTHFNVTYMYVYILVVPQNITVKVASIMLGKSSKMYTLNTILNFPEIKM